MKKKYVLRSLLIVLVLLLLVGTGWFRINKEGNRGVNEDENFFDKNIFDENDFDENEDISEEENLDGEVISYYEDGTIENKMNYKDGELTGEFSYYYKDGNLQVEGMAFGESGYITIYSKDGEVLGTGEIKIMKLCNSYGCTPYIMVRNGTYVKFYNDESIQSISQIHNSVPSFITYYSQDGVIIGEVEYKDYHAYSGVEYSFYSSGQKEKEEYYRDGKNNGPFYRYHENGLIWVDAYFDDGKLTKRDTFGQEGNLHTTAEYIDGIAVKQYFYEKNGALSKIIYQDENGDHLKTEFYDESGNISRTESRRSSTN